MFNRLAVLGTGLIGGSFALAVRRHLGDLPIVGWDKPDVLAQAHERGAITEPARDFATALRGADLVYLALPVGLTLEILPALARVTEQPLSSGTLHAADFKRAARATAKQAHQLAIERVNAFA